MKIALYSQTGSKKGEVEVSDKIFGQKVNHTLIYRLLKLQLANSRAPIAHTKTKAEVRGGGRKPFRQKGTGRARQGSIRNPHYIGGGVAHGPRNTRNFTLDMPKKERRNALFSTLSAKASEDRVVALEKFESENPKTKEFANLLTAMKLEKDTLFVIPTKNETHQRATRNIPYVTTILVNYLNVGDLLKHQNVVFLEDALPRLEEIFVKKTEKKAEEQAVTTES